MMWIIAEIGSHLWIVRHSPAKRC